MDQIVEHGKRYLQDLKKANKAKIKEELAKKQRQVDSDDSDATKKEKTQRDESDDEDVKIPKVYVYPMFMKPGRQLFLVQNNNEDGDRQNWLHKFIAPQRIDKIPLYNKPHKTLIKTRAFDKHNSVFKMWIDDTEQTIKECLEHDFENWKLPNFVKDPSEQERIKTIMIDNGEFLKQMFIQQASRSNAPLLNRTDFSQWL